MSAVRTHIPFATPQQVYQFQWPGLAEGYRTGFSSTPKDQPQNDQPGGSKKYVDYALIATSIYSAATLMRKQSTAVRLIKLGVLAYTAKAYIDRSKQRKDFAKIVAERAEGTRAFMNNAGQSPVTDPFGVATLKTASGPRYKGATVRLKPVPLAAG